MDLIIKNALLPGADAPVDIGVKKGKVSAVEMRIDGQAAQTIDAGQRLVSPPFIDPHLHLDAALTLGQPGYNISGSHPEGIRVWGDYKKAYPQFEDMEKRVRQAVSWAVVHGTLYIRTHIDICDPNLTALKKMLVLKKELADLVTIQTVAFPQDGLLADPKAMDLLIEALDLGVDLIGGIPHCELTREEGVQSVRDIFNLAEKYDRPIDIHCDETDDDHSRFIEVIAAEAFRRGLGSRVSAGHTTSMHSFNNAYAHKLIDLVRKSDINIISNPLDNSVLQARFDTYPKRRGLTRIKELLAAGVNVSLGHDSVMDPWYPLGKADMLQVAWLAVHMGHMSGFDEISTMYQTITDNAAKAFGLTDYGIRPGNTADLIILDCASVYDAIRLSPARLYVIKSGKVIARTRPAEHTIQSQESSRNIHLNL
jgi:cytosine/creatinine deaminase